MPIGADTKKQLNDAKKKQQQQQQQKQKQQAAQQAKEQDRKVNIVNTTPVPKPTGQQTVQAKKQGDIPSSGSSVAPKPAASSTPATSTSTSSTTAPKFIGSIGSGSRNTGGSSRNISGGSRNTGASTKTTGASLSLAVNNLLKNAATAAKPVLPKATPATTVRNYGTTGSTSVPKPTNQNTVQAKKLGDISSGASTTEILRRLTTQTSNTKSKKGKKDKDNPKDFDGVQVAAAATTPAKPTDYGADVNEAIRDKWSSQGRSRNYKDASGNVTSALWENNDRNMIDRLLNNIGNKSSGSSVPSDVENYLVNTTPAGTTGTTPSGTTPYLPTTPAPTPTFDNTKPEWLEWAEWLDQQKQPTVEDLDPGAYTDYLNGFLPEGYNYNYQNRLGEYAQALDNAEADWRNNLGAWANTLTDTLSNNRLNMLNALRQNRASGWTSGAHASADAGGLAQAAGTTAQAANEPMNTLTQEQLKYLATLATKRSDLPGTVASELLGWGSSAAQASAQERGYSMYGREAAAVNAAIQEMIQNWTASMYPEYLDILRSQSR